MARCFVTRALPGPALDRLRARHEVEVWPERLPPPYEELAARAADAEGLLTLLTDLVDAALIEHCPALRAVSNYAVGYDNIDVDAAAARGIAVGNTPDVLTDATADLTFALLLAAARKLPEATAAVAEGDWVTWEPGRFLGAAVQGAVLGIVGMGRIGRAVARRALGFDMTVLYVGGGGLDTGAATGPASEPPRDAGAATAPASELPRDARAATVPASEVALEALLEGSDFVSLHCPLTPSTHHLINADALARMRSSAILINTARGPIVDQTALIEALVSGEIAGAALDVTDPEPPAPDDPLLSTPNLLVVPHIGSATRAAREQMAELAVENLLAGLDGRPMPHQVRPVA
jgi:glyoxylate reductase